MIKNYLTMQTCRLFFAAIALASCSNNGQQATNKNNMKEKMHNEQHSAHAHSGHEFADKSAVEKMAKMFESPEREAMQQPQKITEYLGDLNGKTLMDLGAGTGYFSVRFADKGAHVIAADVSDEFQDYLKTRIEKNKITNIELRKTAYDDPVLKKFEADIVFIANAYHHIDNRVDYFSKVSKGLKPGGGLVVVDYFDVDLPKEAMAPPLNIRVSVDQVVSELRKAGFNHFEINVNMLQYQYIIKATLPAKEI